jgi:hypothetical protein
MGWRGGAPMGIEVDSFTYGTHLMLEGNAIMGEKP